MIKRDLSHPFELIVADLSFSERTRRAIVYDLHVRAAAEYIVSHITDPFALDDIAESMSLNPSYLSRMFKKKTGICLSKFARRVKILVASELLRKDACNVSSAAAKSGFRDVSTFRRNFKLLTDSSPSAYRGARHRAVERDRALELPLLEAQTRVRG